MRMSLLVTIVVNFSMLDELSAKHGFKPFNRQCKAQAAMSLKPMNRNEVIINYLLLKYNRSIMNNV